MSCSSTPALAERRTRLDSSSAVRAPESSSFGSMPIERRMPLALPFSTAIAGRNTIVNPTWKGMTNFAVCRGIASAKFFGTSSPRIIENIVAIAMAMTVEIARTAAPGTPQPDSTGLSRFVSAGSIVYPVSSVVNVMPSCALDRCVEVIFRAEIVSDRRDSPAA